MRHGAAVDTLGLESVSQSLGFAYYAFALCFLARRYRKTACVDHDLEPRKPGRHERLAGHRFAHRKAGIPPKPIAKMSGVVSPLLMLHCTQNCRPQCGPGTEAANQLVDGPGKITYTQRLLFRHRSSVPAQDSNQVLL